MGYVAAEVGILEGDGVHSFVGPAHGGRYAFAAGGNPNHPASIMTYTGTESEERRQLLMSSVCKHPRSGGVREVLVAVGPGVNVRVLICPFSPVISILGRS